MLKVNVQLYVVGAGLGPSLSLDIITFKMKQNWTVGSHHVIA